MCGRWSTTPAPWPLNDADKRKWGPLLPWGLGSLQQPQGQACRLCTTALASTTLFAKQQAPFKPRVAPIANLIQVHVSGGWADDLGSLKKCKMHFMSNPCRHHLQLPYLIDHCACSARLLCDVAFRRAAEVFFVRLRWMNQVQALVTLKTENPNIRIRSADQLGPITTLGLAIAALASACLFCGLSFPCAQDCGHRAE